LTAFFQLETGFSPDAASGAFAQRNSAVGLQHASWGSLSMGRWDMPFKLTQVAVVDPFTDLSIADITGTAINQGNFSNREPNIVQYWSPDIGGLAVKAAMPTKPHRDAQSLQVRRLAGVARASTTWRTPTKGTTTTATGPPRPA
jgi:predicted porin